MMEFQYFSAALIHTNSLRKIDDNCQSNLDAFNGMGDMVKNKQELQEGGRMEVRRERNRRS